MTPASTQILVDFNTESNISNWYVVDDVVMGGRSSGSFELTAAGHGAFSGTVSLENNGGFSSLRHSFETFDVSDYSKVRLWIKGDGKNYQFRVKDRSSHYYSYIYPFETTGDWQTIEIPLGEMYPSFRGRRLDGPNFNQDTLEELTFLISNKRPETFELLINKIELL